jgi:hypothetical protein
VRAFSLRRAVDCCVVDADSGAAAVDRAQKLPRNQSQARVPSYLRYVPSVSSRVADCVAQGRRSRCAGTQENSDENTTWHYMFALGTQVQHIHMDRHGTPVVDRLSIESYLTGDSVVPP